MDKVMDKLKNTKILGAIGLGLLLLGTFLPYIVIEIFGIKDSESLVGYWEGKVMLLVTFANLLFVFKDFIKKYVPQLFNSGMGRAIENAKPIFSLIPTGIALLLNIYLFTTLDSSLFSFGIGFYMIVVGIIVMIAYAFIYKEPTADAVASTPSPEAVANPSAGVAPTPTPMDQPVAAPAPVQEPTPVAAPTEPVTPVAPEATPAQEPTPIVAPTEPAQEPAPAPVAEPAPAPVEQPVQPADPNIGDQNINNQ